MTIIRRKPVDARIERQIVTGLIVSDDFIRSVQSLYKPECLRADFARIVAEWCMEFYTHYKTAPKANIQEIFQEQKLNGMAPDTAELIEEFLAGISSEHEQASKFNAQYEADKTEKYFRLASLENMRMELSQCITGGRTEDGEALIGNFQRVARIETKGIDPFFNRQKIISALDEDSGDRLFRLYGNLGTSIGHFERGQLFAVVASQGVGKSWWLMLIALRALMTGHKVLFLSLEMSERQMILRIIKWLTGLPSKRWAGRIPIPVFDCEHNQTGECAQTNRAGKVRLVNDDGEKPDIRDTPTGYRLCSECRGTRSFVPSTWFKIADRPNPMDTQAVVKKLNELERSGLIRPDRFRLVAEPSDTITIPAFKTYLSNLEYYDNFVPDVIVTDMADKFKSERYSNEYRHGINEVWMGHKAIAQEKHALVVSASQSNTARTGKDIKQGDWAEDIRKLGEIDGGFAINQTPEDKRDGLYRCGVLKARDDDYSLIDKVKVLHQLKIGRPYLDSCIM